MNAIVAVNSDWGIGYNNAQTIAIPEDRRNFQRLTTGGTVIVGKKTFEEIGRPLPGRRNIVLTRERGFRAIGAIIAHSVDKALELAAEEEAAKVFVIGGGSIYNLFLPMCAYAYITKIEAAPPSDTYFPNIDESPDWKLEARGEPQISAGIVYSFNLYKNTAEASLGRTHN